MAAEFSKLLSIGLDPTIISNSIKSANELAVKIKALRDAQKESGVVTAESEGRIKALTQVRNQDLQVVKQANILLEDSVQGQQRLKAILSIQTAALNKLTTEEQLSTKEGQRLAKSVKDISDELEKNEKAVGNARRGVGKYEQALGSANDKIDQLAEAVKDIPGTVGRLKDGFVGMASGLKSATIASLKFLATPLGMAIAAIALVVGAVVGAFKLFSESLNRTEDGAAALSGVMNVFKGIMSGVLKTVEPIALFLVKGLANGFEKLGEVVETVSKGIEKALRFIGMEAAANGLNTITTNIKEASSATAQLAKAEAELNEIQREQGKIQLQFQTRAEKQRQIRDDESKSLKERMQANRDLGDVLTEQAAVETALAKRALEIANLRIKADGASSENKDKKAEAELKLYEIEERVNSQRSEQMTNENSLIRDGVALAKEANASRIAILKEKEEATKEEQAALIQSFEDQRALIDAKAELDIDKATASIENAEKRAETIAAIDIAALEKKIASIDKETTAYTASGDMVGSVDKVKYAKQLAQRAAFEAQLAEMSREASDREFNDAMKLSADKLTLAELQAENEIQNVAELEEKKKQLRLAALQEQLALTKQFFGELTQEEKIQLDILAAMIEKLKADAGKPPEEGTLADGLGIDEEDLEKMEAALETIAAGLNAVSQIVNNQSEVQLNNLDTKTKAELAAVDASTASEKDKAAKKEQIEKKAATEEYKIKKKQFEANKKISIVQAVIAGALGVVSAFQLGPIAGAIAAVLIAATTVSQIASIASSKPPAPPAFASGGYVSGAGTGTSDSIDARLSNGESVNNARTTAMFGRELSAMNAAGGGVDWYRGNGYAQGGLIQKFAAGGIAQSSGSMLQASESNAMMAETFLKMQPVLVLEEFQNVQGRQIRTEQNLSL